MRSQPGVAKTMFETLADRGINIEVISTSEIKISVLIASEYTELAVRSLHPPSAWTRKTRVREQAPDGAIFPEKRRDEATRRLIDVFV